MWFVLRSKKWIHMTKDVMMLTKKIDGEINELAYFAILRELDDVRKWNQNKIHKHAKGDIKGLNMLMIVQLRVLR